MSKASIREQLSSLIRVADAYGELALAVLMSGIAEFLRSANENDRAILVSFLVEHSEAAFKEPHTVNQLRIESSIAQLRCEQAREQVAEAHERLGAELRRRGTPTGTTPSRT